MATKKKTAATKERVDPYPTPEHPPEETLPGEVLDPDGGFPEEHKMSFTISLKEAILLHLWGYSGQAKDEETKAQIIESHDILKEGIVAVKLMELDRKKGTYKLRTSRKKKFSEEHINNHLDKPWTRLALADLYGFRKELLRTLKTSTEKPTYIKTGLHLASQFLGPLGGQTQLNFAEQLDKYTQETGLTMNNRPLGFGLDLNTIQQTVATAILGAFSQDEYQGNITLPKEEVLIDQERSSSYVPSKLKAANPNALYRRAYANIPQLPTIQLTLAEIVRLAGMDHDRQGDKEKIKEAVAHLGSAQYVFYWKRKAFLMRGNMAIRDKDKDGLHKWEEVVEAGSLFRVKHVLDEQTKQLKYFEISPSAVVLDQVNPHYGGNYFLMVPSSLHAEVREIVGKGQRSTSYTFAFLMYLLAEYERHRRHAKKGTVPEVTIAKTWEEIAQRIKMPETVWKRNRQSAVARLEKVYQVAKELGYLKSYKRGEDGIDTLELEPSKYFHPEREIKQLQEEQATDKEGG